MKKMLMAIILMFGILIPAISLADTKGIVDKVSKDFWDNQPDSYWFNQDFHELLEFLLMPLKIQPVGIYIS